MTWTTLLVVLVVILLLIILIWWNTNQPSRRQANGITVPPSLSTSTLITIYNVYPPEVTFGTAITTLDSLLTTPGYKLQTAFTGLAFPDLFQQLSNGTIKAAFTPFNYDNATTNSILSTGVGLFSSIPFGFNDYSMVSWLYQNIPGRGLDILNTYLQPFNVYAIPLVVLPGQAIGWTNNPLTDDTKTWNGRKMRTFGFATELYSRLGATVTTLRGEDIVPAYKNDSINWAEFALPSNDIALGLNSMGAGYYYVGSYLEPATVIYLLFNRPYWLSLPATYRRQFMNSSAYVSGTYLDNVALAQKTAVNQIQSQGIKVLQVPTKARQVVQDTWNSFVSEQMATDPLFKQTMNDISFFEQNNMFWTALTDTWRTTTPGVERPNIV